jgi:hypothetical protein
MLLNYLNTLMCRPITFLNNKGSYFIAIPMIDIKVINAKKKRPKKLGRDSFYIQKGGKSMLKSLSVQKNYKIIVKDSQ